jgi:hypothetical protein
MLGRSPIPKIKPYRAIRKEDFGEKSKKGMDSFYVCEIIAVPKKIRVSCDNARVIKSYGSP